MANSLSGCSRWQMIFPPCSALVRHFCSAVSGSGLLSMRGMDILEWVQQRATKLVRDWSTGHPVRGWEVGLFSLEKRRLGGDPVCCLELPGWKIWKRWRYSLFSRWWDERQRRKMECGKFWLDIRKYFYHQSGQILEQVPRECVGSSSLEVLNTC